MNVLSALAEAGVPYRQHGDVPRLVDVCCPFCRDSKWHCGVFADHGNYVCLRCGVKGPFERLLSAASRLSRARVKALATAARRERPALVVPKPAPATPKLPPGSVPVVSGAPWPELLAFLERRCYSVADCTRRACFYVPSGVGRYCKRLVIPVLDPGGRYVAWQARDVTGRAERNYLNPGFPLKEYLYRPEAPRKNDVVLVEGVFDQWRAQAALPDHAIYATFGAELTARQLLAIVTMRPLSVTVLWDPDAEDRAVKATKRIAVFVPNARMARLVSKGTDPDTASREEIRQSITNTL